ncbi:hypothetical protein ONZ45_g14344 [Pleurotus djamor]|nr:hypothetical protein ONZ45_g14344 [Pleurotus djamor]
MPLLPVVVYDLCPNVSPPISSSYPPVHVPMSYLSIRVLLLRILNSSFATTTTTTFIDSCFERSSIDHELLDTSLTSLSAASTMLVMVVDLMMARGAPPCTHDHTTRLPSCPNQGNTPAMTVEMAFLVQFRRGLLSLIRWSHAASSFRLAHGKLDGCLLLDPCSNIFYVQLLVRIIRNQPTHIFCYPRRFKDLSRVRVVWGFVSFPIWMDRRPQVLTEDVTVTVLRRTSSPFDRPSRWNRRRRHHPTLGTNPAPLLFPSSPGLPLEAITSRTRHQPSQMSARLFFSRYVAILARAAVSIISLDGTAAVPSILTLLVCSSTPSRPLPLERATNHHGRWPIFFARHALPTKVQTLIEWPLQIKSIAGDVTVTVAIPSLPVTWQSR